MERTYQEFVDNGLYVLGYYLNKKVEDITEEDLVNSVDLMSEQISRYLYYTDDKNKSYLATITSVTNFNSFYTQIQSSRQKETFDNDKKRFDFIKKELSILANIEPSIYDKNCNICGKKKVKINFTKETVKRGSFVVTRSLMAGLCANTFANSMNNLREIDICPHCLYLSILGTLNVLKASGTHIILNSDSDKFMKKHTEGLQYKLIKEGINTNCNKYQTENYINLIINNFITESRLRDGNYIQQIDFTNGQNVKYNSITLEKEKIIFLSKIYNNTILRKFLTSIILLFDKVKEDKILIFSIYEQYEKGNISNEELNLLITELEGYELKEQEKILINKIVSKLRKAYEHENIVKKLKINTLDEFKQFLFEETENIEIIEKEEEYDILLSKWKTLLEYIQIKNLIENNNSKKIKGGDINE